MIVHQAYRFVLDPSPRAARALASHVGARRFVFNWGLAFVKERARAYKTGAFARRRADAGNSFLPSR